MSMRECYQVKYEFVEYHKRVSDDEFCADLIRVAEKLTVQSFSAKQYDENGSYHSDTISRRFGCWTKALIRAGLTPGFSNRAFTTEELFENIEKVWIAKGKQPVRSDMNNKSLSSASSGAYLRRFGSWNAALQAFVEYINNEEESQPPVSVQTDPFNRKREINLRTRFLVMQRDNFKCRLCGASPANNPEIVLQIDHIVPWSKGGKTTIENLQTLCSNCNLGKGNLEL